MEAVDHGAAYPPKAVISVYLKKLNPERIRAKAGDVAVVIDPDFVV